MLIECRSVWELVHFLHHLSHTPTAPSFNSNSFLLSSSSSLHTHLFTCHFLFLSITISLHFPFLCHRSPSLHLLYLYPTTFSSLLVLPLFYTSVYMQIPYVHHLSTLTHKFTLSTVYLLLCVPSSITPLSFAFLWFVCFSVPPSHSAPHFISSSCRTSGIPPFYLHHHRLSSPTHHPSSPTCGILSSSSIFISAVSEWPESVSLHYRPSPLQLRNTFKNQQCGCHIALCTLIRVCECKCV